jgi:hypothetical protein
MALVDDIDREALTVPDRGQRAAFQVDADEQERRDPW